MSDNFGLFAGLSVVGLLVILGLVFAFSPFTVIDAGERGIVLRLGSVDRVLGDGFHWINSITEDVEKIDVRTQKEQVKASSASKDLQSVQTEIALNYHLIADRVGDLWKNTGKDYKSRVIDPAIQEAVKASTAKYTAEELVTKRELVREDIKVSLVDRLQKEFIQVTEVSIVDFDFSQSFNQAIEAKVTAEQNALAAKNKLEQSKYEADQRIAQAKGEAEAIRIQAEAITSQGGAEYVKLKVVEKWDGRGCTTYCMGSGVQAPIPLVNIK